MTLFLNLFIPFPGPAFLTLKLASTGLSAMVVATTLFIFHREAQNVKKPSQCADFEGHFVEHTAEIRWVQWKSSFDKETPLIVAWTKFFEDSLKNLLAPTLKDCKLICDFVDREEYNIYNINKVPQDFFNATITYRRDSRYFWPYGRFELRTASDDASTFVTKKQLSEAVEKKNKGSLIIVSHCGTHSKREHIIRELGKYTEITIKGRCEMQLSTRKITRSTSLITEIEVNELIATHRFYIAFENSNCKDYVTEKYFNRTSQLLVPVVLDRKIYEDAGLPPHSFIAADDFDSINELGDYLNSLRYNNSEYLRYFDWTHTFRKPNTYVSDALCRICEDIHRGEKMTIKDIKEYYGANQCTSAFHAHRLLARGNSRELKTKLL